MKIEKAAKQLDNFFRASTELMQVMARACGHDHLKGAVSTSFLCSTARLLI